MALLSQQWILLQVEPGTSIPLGSMPTKMEPSIALYPADFDACELDNTLTFNKDSTTGVFDEGALKCSQYRPADKRLSMAT